MNWQTFFTAVASTCGVGVIGISIDYSAYQYRENRRTERNWLIALFILTVVCGSVAAGLS